jgi:hypothetical protein
MNNYDNEYYLLGKLKRRDDIPSLSADDRTSTRDYNHTRQDPSSPPLVFVNGAMEYNAKRGVQSIPTPPEILFDGSNMLVKLDVKEALLALKIPYLCMHPATYIHDDGKRYEDYWYVAFTDRFDCWDRKRSDYDRDSEPLRIGGSVLEEVYSYRLDVEALEKKPLRERLFFQMGGSTAAPLVCHESLYPIFHGTDGKGARLTLVADS